MFSLSDSDLTREQKDYLQSTLQSGETLLWAGCPKLTVPRRMLAESFFGLLAFWFFVVSKVFYNGDADPLSASDSIPLVWALIVLLIAAPFLGLFGYFVFFRPLAYLYRLSRAVYAVTDRRYLAAVNYPYVGWRLREWTGSPSEISIEKDGSGNIVLEYAERHTKNSVYYEPLGLLHVPNIESVKQVILQSEDEEWLSEEDEEDEEADEPEPPRKKTDIRVPVFMVLAAAAWVTALYTAYNSYSALSVCEKTEGVVTYSETRSHHSRRGISTNYYAHFRYTVDGNTYEGQQRAGSGSPKYREGEHLTVLYNPADPQESYMDDAMDAYHAPLIVGGAALVLTIVSLILFRRLRRSRRIE